MTTATVTPRWLKRKVAARTYGISDDTLDRLRASGVVRTKKNGRSVLVEVASLEAWVEGLEDA